MRVRSRGVERVVLGALLSVMACQLLSARTAKANDFEEFEAARGAYDSQDYVQAVALFDALAGGDTPALSNRSLVLESKKYLGASYLFLGKLRAAEQEFERLLRMDPEYVLDPLGFPEEVQRLFARVKTRLDTERKVAEDARLREEDRLRRSQTARDAEERARWARLTQLAEAERVEEVRSRWVALMPFGIGQFQNGHVSLGAILAVSECSLLVISFASWLVHENLRGQQVAESERDSYNLTERASRYTNQISMALFGVLAVTGIIDAQVRFQGSREYERKRPLPPDLLSGPELSIGPGSANLRVRF
jgi:tetratricopeptide (TPR) repeat protein